MYFCGRGDTNYPNHIYIPKIKVFHKNGLNCSLFKDVLILERVMMLSLSLFAGQRKHNITNFYFVEKIICKNVKCIFLLSLWLFKTQGNILVCQIHKMFSKRCEHSVGTCKTNERFLGHFIQQFGFALCIYLFIFLHPRILYLCALHCMVLVRIRHVGGTPALFYYFYLFFIFFFFFSFHFIFIYFEFISIVCVLLNVLLI